MAMLVALFGLVVLRNGVMVRALSDDAYIFLRYARNLLDGHGFAWNPGGPPADGITSPLWLGLCVAAMAAGDLIGAGAETMLKALTLAMAGCWLAAFYRMGRSAWPGGSRLWPVLVAGAIVALDEAFEAAARWGMETLAAAALVALTVHALLRLERLARRNKTGPARPLAGAQAFAALCAFLAVLARPELALFAVAAPALLAWKLRTGTPWRGNPCVPVVAAVVALGAGYGAFKLAVWGSLIPWPAYVKSGLSVIYEDYDPDSHLMLRGIAFEFLRHYALLLAPLGVALAHGRLRRELAWLWAPLVALIAYWAATLPIMGYHFRYYQPLVPLLAAVAFLMAAQARPAPSAIAQTRALAPVALMLVACLLAWNLWRLRLVRLGSPLEGGRIAVHEEAPVMRIIRFLQEAPPGLTIAATEVGMLGFFNPEATIVDLSGLNDRAFSTGFDADALFARKPDAITLVHYHYRGMVRRIVAHPEFARFRAVLEADAHPPARPDLSHTIYMDPESPFYREMMGHAGL